VCAWVGGANTTFLLAAHFAKRNTKFGGGGKKLESESEGGQKFLPPTPFLFARPSNWISKMPSKLRKNIIPRRFAPRQHLSISLNVKLGGDDVPKLEPRKWLKSCLAGRQVEDLDENIRELRAIYKVHPEWFEVPKPKSDKGKSELDYSIS